MRWDGMGEYLTREGSVSVHQEAEHALADAPGAQVVLEAHLHARLAHSGRHVRLEVRRPGQHAHVHARRRLRALLRICRVLEARRRDCSVACQARAERTVVHFTTSKLLGWK